MPPKKKSASLKGEEAHKVVEQYLCSQRKPFAINDIVQNLHGKITKNDTVKILEELVQDDKIILKTFGKILIYSSKDVDINYEEEFGKNELEGKYSYQCLTQLNEELMELSRDETTAKKELEETLKIPTNEQLRLDVQQLEMEVENFQESLKNVKENTNAETRLECTHILNTTISLEKEIRLRKKIFNNIVLIIKDQVRPKSMKEFMEDIGVENYI
ncbi:similar to Saccharomyces cerevisiae YGL033W HOP2 Meiosis-specific protein that localizes to chromosomes [Maudiozyma barnettii]|uniref:Similar to Saccharomyces cerevisiae YGL033W HOP2 Meiosis-specific protein that localizes to chromosomes n=1 Tax=Maudiozyma barnettii TaxID=61262 RepID=A0A8H2VJZ0_9SACH|nr:Hop2p [Kazachstania barnettii]CAB4256750.1 similar to Saccharomyces cerevisiae YGL033W HOP2 Meiosis-specific protein that localizes to chromosomes [Kazachstania barnettii]CAD1785404.1 similar to Saccharomyces cerevisiae YGL033W HOP2 Meiosis-specific protein that localizes to chromosomes [Kazachstania barnettii]